RTPGQAIKHSKPKTPVSDIAAAKWRLRAAIRNQSIAPSAAAYVEGECAFRRVGIDRDDMPTDRVGPRRQGFQPDLEFIGMALGDLGIAEVDALSAAIGDRHA